MRIPIDLFHQPAHGRPANRVPFGNSGQRHPTTSILDHLLPIDVQPSATDLPTLQFCPSHATFRPLHDQRPFQLANRSENDDHGPIHFLEVLDELNHLNIALISFRENIDTSGPLERLLWAFPLPRRVTEVTSFLGISSLFWHRVFPSSFSLTRIQSREAA